MNKTVPVVNVVLLLIVLLVAQPAVSSPSSLPEDIAQSIRKAVRALEYPDTVSEKMLRMVEAWHDETGASMFSRWDASLGRFADARVERASKSHAERAVAIELCRAIKNDITYESQIFELEEMLDSRRANCIGYIQTFCILASSLGLDARPILVHQMDEGKSASESNEKQVSRWRRTKGKRSTMSPVGHAACIVVLPDFTIITVELTPPKPWVSSSFDLYEMYRKTGISWTLRKKPLFPLHKEIQLLEFMDLLSLKLNNQGVAHCVKGAQETALPLLTRAIVLTKNYAAPYHNRGCALFEMGKTGEAVADFSTAIKIFRNYGAAYSNRGVAYYELGKYKKAIEDYTVAIRLEPKSHPHAYLNRGWAYRKREDFRRALEDFTRAIGYASFNPDPYLGRALTYYDLGDQEKALIDLNTAIWLDPEFALAHYHKGRIYGELGQSRKAADSFRTAHKIDSSLPLPFRLTPTNDVGQK